jgi:hypothetical protein
MMTCGYFINLIGRRYDTRPVFRGAFARPLKLSRKVARLTL